MPSIRQAIIDAANREADLQEHGIVGPDGPVSQRGEYQFKEGGTNVRGGYRRLQKIFLEGIRGFTERQANDPTFKNTLGPQPYNTSWCGIFASSVLQHANVDAYWKLGGKVGDGLLGTGVRRINLWTRGDTSIGSVSADVRSAESIYLEPGDVAILEGSEGHHVIVVGIEADRKSLRTVEGNRRFQEIGRDNTRKVKQIVTVIKIVTETRFDPPPFDSPRALPAGFVSQLKGDWKVVVSGSTYYYRFAQNNTLTWGSAPGGIDGSGLWHTAGGGLLRIVWKASGSIELWKPTGDTSASGKYYYHADPTLRVEATRA